MSSMYIQHEKYNKATSQDVDQEDRTYPLQNSFDDDDDDVDEGSEWQFGGRLRLRSRSTGRKTSEKQHRQRQKGRRRTSGEDDPAERRERKIRRWGV